MRRRDFLTATAGSALSLANWKSGGAAQEEGTPQEHDFRTSADVFSEGELRPAGEYYEATVPDTLDLAERAQLSVHGLTSFLNPKRNYEPFGHAYLNVVPCYMTQIDGGAGQPNWGKITESIVMARMMSGSDVNLDIERKTLEGMLAWEKGGGSVPTARNMMSLMSLYDQRPDGRLRALIERLAQTFGRHSQHQDGFTFIYDQPPNMKDSKIGIMGFGHQAFIHGSCMRALCRWVAHGADPQYLALAGEYKDFLMQPRFWQPEAEPKAVFGADHAHFMGHHHSYTAGMMGLLWYADLTNDPRLKQFVREGYEYFRTWGIARMGVFGESCTTGDMTFLALKLSDLGVGDYWDDADGYVRNHLAELQITDAAKVERVAAGKPLLARHDPHGHLAYQKLLSEVKEQLPLTPIEEDADNVAARNVGAFLSDSGQPNYIPKQRFLWTICCTGNCTPALYEAWESTVRFRDGLASVNLLLNRASPWLDVDSYLPYEGRVVIRNKSARAVGVRIPKWADMRSVKATVNSKAASAFPATRYLVFTGLKRGDRIDISFPMVEWIETHTLEWKAEDFWMECTNPGHNWKPKDHPDLYTLHLRGNTVISVEPRYTGEEYRLYDREEMRAARAPLKKVRRFVTPALVKW